MLYSEFREKEVICIKDCKRLGHVCNLEIDECNGAILKIMVPGRGKMFQWFFCEQEIVIPFRCIKKIGPDIILVEI